jgi:hypothetical protein
LQHARGDKNLAARMLGVATRTIYRHLEREAEEEGEESSAPSQVTSGDVR